MKKATLIYDGECGLCRSAADWIWDHAVPGTIELLPCQDPDRAARFPQVSREACMDAMHLVEPDGTVFAGEQALPCLLSRMRGWRWAALVFRVPGVSLLAAPVYRLVARNRQALSAVLKHKRKPDDASCGPGGSCKL